MVDIPKCCLCLDCDNACCRYLIYLPYHNNKEFCSYHAKGSSSASRENARKPASTKTARASTNFFGAIFTNDNKNFIPIMPRSLECARVAKCFPAIFTNNEILFSLGQGVWNGLKIAQAEAGVYYLCCVCFLKVPFLLHRTLACVRSCEFPRIIFLVKKELFLHSLIFFSQFDSMVFMLVDKS